MLGARCAILDMAIRLYLSCDCYSCCVHRSKNGAETVDIGVSPTHGNDKIFFELHFRVPLAGAEPRFLIEQLTRHRV
jgi:hypothetical protein